MTPLLFSPIQLRGLRLKNRVVVSPMCQYSAENGIANDWHFVHLGSRAVGGAGLIVCEATAVSPEGRITPGDLGLWDDSQIAPLSRIVDFAHQHGAKMCIQLAHAGRKASCDLPWKGGRQLPTSDGGWKTRGPSAVPFLPTDQPPRPIELGEIPHIVGAFVLAAQRAVAVGFDSVMLHAAHGYLLHSFLSPLSNQRTDGYGGSLDGRILLTSEIATAIRREIPDAMPLLVRISATDWRDGGWDLESSIHLAQILRGEGVDLIDCSSGGLVPDAVIPIGPGYQVPFAKAIREQAQIPTGAVGMITDPQQAESILQNDSADLISLARAELADPYWPLHAAKILGGAVDVPTQYIRAF